LVAANQSAFVRGRSIHDNFMLVQHSIKSLHKKKVSSLFLKLDVSKAFDSVSWAFLTEVLSHLGFGPMWRSMISNLLTSSSTQVLLNGSPGIPIKHRRGLRQGILFLLCCSSWLWMCSTVYSSWLKTGGCCIGWRALIFETGCPFMLMM
jgi:hypothetical protein